MPGVLPLHAFQVGVEGTKGTAVATTRELYPSPTGYLDPGFGLSFHEGAQRGTYSNITTATSLSYAPTVSYQSEPSHGVTYDDLVLIGSSLIGGQTPVGAGADKTWTFTPAQTAHTFDTYTLNCYDGVQGYEIDYGFLTGWSLSAGYDDLTQVSMDWVGQAIEKTTIDVVAANTAAKMPSALWTVKYAATQAALTAASVLSTTMRGFTLTCDTGLRPRYYNDGTRGFGAGVAGGNLGGTLQMTWDATADAVTQYDNYAAQTKSFFRLACTGPVLGGSFYSVQADVCVLWESVQPGASESDGVMEYNLNGRWAYDATWTNSFVLTVVNSLTALP